MAKITDPSKLLPSVKSSSAIVKVGKNNTINISQKKISASALAKRPITDVGGKLVKIESFLKGDLVASQKKSEQKRKEKERQDFSEAEKRLELPKISGFKLPKLPEPPSLGFLDRVKRFIFFTALGWALPKILEFLPKLERFAKIIGGVYNFAEGLFGKLFDGFMSLVKFGGDLKDKTIGFIAQAKVGSGGDYKAEFDKLEKKFNDFVNISILAGVLSADIGLAAFDEYNKWNKLNKGGKPGSGDYAKGYAVGYAAGLASRGKGPRYRAPGEAAAGRTLGENVARQALTRERMLARTGPKGPFDRVRRGFRGAAAQLETGTLFRRGAGFQKALYNLPGKIKSIPGAISKPFSRLKGSVFSKFAGPFSKFLGAAAPFAGAAVGAIDAKSRFDSGDKIGGWMASVSAALDAFAGAAGLATIAEGATVLGLPLAAITGAATAIATGVSIGIDVILLIRDLLNVFGVKTFNKGGRIVRGYQGGGSTRNGKPVSGAPKRTLRTTTTKKPTPVTIPKTQPGKDIGGEKKIREFYAKPKDPSKRYVRPPGGWLSNLNVYDPSQNGGQKDESPYTALFNMSKSLKNENSSLIKGVLGLISSGVDMALGQKTDQRVFKSFFNSIGYVADTLAQQRMSTSMSSLMMQIRGFAEGGSVPSRELRNSSAPNTAELLAKLIGPTIDQRIEEAVQNIEKELRLKGGDGTRDGNEPPSSDDGSDIPIEVDPGQIIGRVGSTGLSEAPHIHIENYATAGGPIPDGVKSSILVNGKPMTSGVKTSPVGWRMHPVLGVQKYHSGEDWDNNWNGKPISLTGGLKFVKYVADGSDPRFAGYGNVVVIQSPDGKKYFIAHLQSGPNNLSALRQTQQQKRNQQIQQMSGTGNRISGQASWYGAAFHGNPTSVPGETFDKSKLTAAMSRPGWNPSGGNPFYVEVTNTANGKKVRVKVNDSGPYEPDLKTPHRTRVIDLSEAAFKKIATLGTGVINVTVEKLGAAPRTTPPPQQQPPGQPVSRRETRTPEELERFLRPSSSPVPRSTSVSQLSGSGSRRKGIIRYGGQTYFQMGNNYYEEIPGRGINQIDKRIYDMVPRQQGGGLIAPSRPNRSIPNQFTSYGAYNQQKTIVAVLPIIEKISIPTTSSNDMIGGSVMMSYVNNDMDLINSQRG